MLDPSDWYRNGMKTTIDKAGRLVIPRGMRAQVGLTEGGEVEVAVHGSAILIEPVAGEDLHKEGSFLVIPASGQVLDDDAVRGLRFGDQR
jgi:AbrB family looped-hinge helix DNA binding protein